MNKESNLTFYSFLALALLVGLIGVFIGFYLDNESEALQCPLNDCPSVKPEIIKEYVNVTQEVRVADASLYLEQAIDDFMLEVEDNDDYLTCDNDEYDFDQISISKVYDDYSVSFSEDKEEINFQIKLKYDEEDESACRETYDVSAVYEEDEDVVIEID